MAQTIFQKWELMNSEVSLIDQQQMLDFRQNGRTFNQIQIDTWEAKNNNMSDDNAYDAFGLTDTISLADFLEE